MHDAAALLYRPRQLLALLHDQNRPPITSDQTRFRDEQIDVFSLSLNHEIWDGIDIRIRRRQPSYRMS